MSVLRLDGVRRMFGDRGLRRGDLAVDEGRIAAVIGSNASGKSTLLRLAAGILRPQAGRREGPAPHATGWAEEDPALYLDRTPRDYLALFARLRGAQADAAAGALAGWELVELADARIGSLSRGQRRRLTLARALLGDPRLVLLDEPWSGLDVTWRDAAAAAVRAARDRGAAVVFTGHRAAEAVALADTVTLVWGGCTVATVGAASLAGHAAGLEVRRAEAAVTELAPVAGAHSVREFGGVHAVLLEAGTSDPFAAAQAERGTELTWLGPPQPLNDVLDEH